MSSCFNRCGPPARRAAGSFCVLSSCVVLGLALFPGTRARTFFSPDVHAQQPRTVNDRVYTEAQANRGQAIYKDRCSSCHGAALEGSQAPPLTGDAFIAVWGGPLSELVRKITKTMPADNPGKLTPRQAADLVSYVLQVGKFPAGQAELGADEAVLRQITLPMAQSASRSPIAPGAAQTPSFPPAGNLAQFMRGILFPSSNLIFNVQTWDPGAPLPQRPPGDTSNAPFSWVNWGAGIYTGWELVDYAAVAVAEAAPLMLTPGRRCENGRPVPVERADWIKFTMDMADAGRAAYKASQTRSQDAVSEATNQLADSCLNCHLAYRDKPVKNARANADPGNKAARCLVP
jgi:mono/diheme cytochrome c family protein